jgi:hypothetical protein
MGTAYGTYEGERQNMHGFGGGNLKERYLFKDLSTDKSIILKCISKKQAGRARTGLIWLRIGTGLL